MESKMEWRISAVTITAVTILFLILVFLYLSFRERRDFLQLWIIGWSLYFLRYMLEIISLLVTGGVAGELIPAGMAAFSLGGAYLLFMGMLGFTRRPRRAPLWLLPVGSAILYVILRFFLSVSGVWCHVPVVLVTGTFFLIMGVYILRFRQEMVNAPRYLLGGLFILWGVWKYM